MPLARALIPLALASLSVSGLSLSACDDGGTSAPAARPPAEGPPTSAQRAEAALGDPSLPLGFDRATTQGAVAVRNLGAQIEGYEAQLRRRPEDVGLMSQIIDLRLSRTQFLGSYDDFSRTEALADAAIAVDEGAGRRLRSRVHTALHAFEAAEADLGAAAQMSPAQAGTLALALGRDLTPHIAAAESAVAARGSYGNLTHLAALLAGAGRFDDADAAYRAALAAYKDVSPFPVAWVAFQRGVMWGEMADRPDRALVLYREAVRRLPSYVVANVHLAELEAEVGLKGQAMSRLRKIVDAADPEPAGLLAELLPPRDPDRALLTAASKAKYEALFDAYPLAFLDHGAEFFMGPGADPARALALARKNLEIRQNDRAYLVGIEAALAADDTDQACAWAQAAGPAPVSVPLKQLQAELQPGCP